MKFRLKALLLMLITVILVLCTFAVGVYANGDTEKSIASVGSYIPIEGVWMPSSADVYYAIFASEDEYLSGALPVVTNLSDGLDDEAGKVLRTEVIAAYNSAYVCLYDDAYITSKGSDGSNASNRFKAGQDITIDLLGNTLYSNSNNGVLYIGDYSKILKISFTLKNGIFDSTEQCQYHRGLTLNFENVVYKGIQFGYDSGYDYCKFKDCEVTLSSNMPFYLSGHDSAIDSAQIIFENTDLTLTSSSIASSASSVSALKNDAVFGGYHYRDKFNWQIVFDKDSSIDCPNMTVCPNYISVYNRSSTGLGTPTVYLELGFKFNSNLVPNFKSVSSTDGKVYYENGDNGAPLCRVLVVEPGTKSEAKYTVYSAGEGMSTFDIPRWTYAFYENEAAYLNGEDPLSSSENTYIKPEDISSSDGSYLVLFKDIDLIYTDDTPVSVVPPSQSFVINLNGVALCSNYDVLLGDGDTECSVVIKGGAVNADSIVANGQVKLDIIDVVLSLDSIRTDNEVRLDSCEVTLTSSMPFVLNHKYNSTSLKVINTTLTLTSTDIATGEDDTVGGVNNAIFTVFSSTTQSTDCHINLDSRSRMAIATSSPIWLSVVCDNASSSNPLLYMETGFGFTKDAVTAFEYTYSSDGGDTYELLSDPELIKVVIPGTSNSPETINIVDLGEGFAAFDKEKWAVFTSRDSYLNGEKALYTNFNDGIDDESLSDVLIRASFIKTLGDCYIVLYDDVILNTKLPTTSDTLQNIISEGQNVVINLNGHSLSTRADMGTVIIGIYGQTTRGSFRLENGTFNSSAQLQFGPGTTLGFDNVTVNATKSLGYDSGGSLELNGCTLNSSASVVFYLGANNGAHLWVKNTDINLTGTIDSSLGIFQIGNSVKNFNTQWDILFDSESSITSKNTLTGPWVSLQEYAANTFKEQSHIYIELGFSFAAGTLPQSLYNIKEKGSDGTISSDYITRPFDSKFAIYYVEKGTTSQFIGDIYACIGENGLYKLSGEMLTDGISWYTKQQDSRIWLSSASKYVSGKTEPVITNAYMATVADGSIIKFVSDVRVHLEGSDKEFKNFANNLILDLGGNTLYADCRIMPDKFLGSVYRNSFLTIKNGAIVSGSPDHAIFGHIGTGGKLTLLDLDISFTGNRANSTAVYIYAGEAEIIGCNIVSPSSVVSYGVTSGTYPGLTIRDSVLTASENIIILAPTATSGFDYTVENCVINSKNVINVIASTTASENNFINVNISECEIKGNILNSVSGALASVRVSIGNSLLSQKPTNPTSPHVITYAEGEKVVDTDNEMYPVRVTSVSLSYKSNLVLDSGLTVKLYIPVDTNITALHIDGKSYDIATLTETVEMFPYGRFYSVTLASLNPDFAAEAIAYSVSYTECGMVNTVRLDYYVIDYIDSLLASDYSYLIKELAVSAVDYIYAAYTYNNKSNELLSEYVLSERYLLNKPEFVIAEECADNEGLAGVIASAQLDLGASMKIRFNIDGALTSTEDNPLVIQGKDYIVTDGKYADCTYIEIELLAHELYDTVISIEYGDVDREYSLRAYAYSVSMSEEVTEGAKALVSAFYSYCYYADAYYNASHGE